MKYLLLLLFSSTCWATEYKFTFNIQDGRKVMTLKYKVEAANRNEALRKAGKFCGQYFGVGTRDLSEGQIDEVLNACANPSEF